MATTTREGCPIRWYSPSTSRPTANGSFSSSFFAIRATSEQSHRLLQSRLLDCNADCPEVQPVIYARWRQFTAPYNAELASARMLRNSLPGNQVIQPEPLAGREDIMTGTNRRLATVTRGAGDMRATEQPVILGMAGRADPQRTTDFQAVLLAMAGHDLRQPLQIIQSSHELLGIGLRTKSEQRLLQKGQHAINRLNGQLDQLLGAVRLYEHSKGAKLSPVALEPLFRQARHENE